MPSRTDELNRIITSAALTIDPKGRLSSVCEKAKLESPAVRAAIRRGYFTINQVDALTRAFGDELIPRDTLLRRDDSRQEV